MYNIVGEEGMVQNWGQANQSEGSYRNSGKRWWYSKGKGGDTQETEMPNHLTWFLTGCWRMKNDRSKMTGPWLGYLSRRNTTHWNRGNKKEVEFICGKGQCWENLYGPIQLATQYKSKELKRESWAEDMAIQVTNKQKESKAWEWYHPENMFRGTRE